MEKRVSCIIPFYNEGRQLLEVLRVVSQVKNIDQVICVDDGSSSRLLSVEIQKSFPGVELVSLPYNSGKAAAVQHGLAFCTGDIILLMDADLVGVNRRELENAIHVMKRDARLSMIILRRMKATWAIRLIRGDVLLSGERLLKKHDLESILHSAINGYQLEAAINNYMKNHCKKVIWMPHSAKNTYKVVKAGIFKGLLRDLKMYASIVSYMGWNTFLNHMLTFCNKKADSAGMEK